MVKGHTSSVASLSQHAIKVVFTAGREEPKIPRDAEEMDQMDEEGLTGRRIDDKSRNTGGASCFL